MKKAIVVVILVVYVASIAIVNFFGLEIKQFDQIIYTDSILCGDEEGEKGVLRREGGGEIGPSGYSHENGKYIPVFTFPFLPSADGKAYTKEDESLAYNPNAVEVLYRILPTNATDTVIEFIYDEESPIAYFDAAKKTAVFLTTGTFLVTIRALDGSNVTTQLYIRAV